MKTFFFALLFFLLVAPSALANNFDCQVETSGGEPVGSFSVDAAREGRGTVPLGEGTESVLICQGINDEEVLLNCGYASMGAGGIRVLSSMTVPADTRHFRFSEATAEGTYTVICKRGSEEARPH